MVFILLFFFFLRWDISLRSLYTKWTIYLFITSEEKIHIFDIWLITLNNETQLIIFFFPFFTTWYPIKIFLYFFTFINWKILLFVSIVQDDNQNLSFTLFFYRNFIRNFVKKKMGYHSGFFVCMYVCMCVCVCM